MYCSSLLGSKAKLVKRLTLHLDKRLIDKSEILVEADLLGRLIW